MPRGILRKDYFFFEKLRERKGREGRRKEGAGRRSREGHEKGRTGEKDEND
jgi:hypothetical protein